GERRCHRRDEAGGGTTHRVDRGGRGGRAGCGGPEGDETVGGGRGGHSGGSVQLGGHPGRPAPGGGISAGDGGGTRGGGQHHRGQLEPVYFPDGAQFLPGRRGRGPSHRRPGGQSRHL